MKVNINKFPWINQKGSVRSKTGILLEILLNILKCLMKSLAPLKFLLWQYQFLSILVRVLCEFVMVPGVYILLIPQEEEAHYFSCWMWTVVYIQQPIHQKHLNLCLASYYYVKVIVEWKKKGFSYVMVFIMKPNSNLRFQFVFGFNECI